MKKRISKIPTHCTFYPIGLFNLLGVFVSFIWFNKKFILGDFGNYIELGTQCPQCNRKYKHKRSLQHHLKFECGKEPQFQCPVCPAKHKSRSNLYMHTRNKHGLELLPKKT